MNHSYQPQQFDHALEIALVMYCKGLPKDLLGRQPFISRDPATGGIRVCRLSHYDTATAETIINGADQIFAEIKAKHLTQKTIELNSVLKEEPVELISRAEAEAQREQEFLTEVEDGNAGKGNSV